MVDVHHIDARIVQSKVRLKEAFLQLIEEKPFRSITVSELIKKAEINRSTFYHHYLDKWDLRDQFIQEILALFIVPFDDCDLSVPINIDNLFYFTERSVRNTYLNIDEYKVIFNPHLEIDILKDMSGIYYSFMMDWIAHQDEGFKTQYPAQLFSEIYAASAVATIKMAFTSDEFQSPDEAVAFTLKLIRSHLEKGFFRAFIEK